MPRASTQLNSTVLSGESHSAAGVSRHSVGQSPAVTLPGANVAPMLIHVMEGSSVLPTNVADTRQ